MLELEIDTTQLERELDSLRERTMRRIRERLTDRLMARALDSVRNRTPVESGEARDGWNSATIAIREEGDRTERSVTNDVEHVVYLEYGTRQMRAQHIARRSLAELSGVAGGIAAEIVFEEWGER